MSKYNQSYWDRFYAANERIPTTPSTFAQLLLPWVESKPSCTLVELGCGNGRDALYFAQSGIGHIVGIDLAHSSIAQLIEAVEHDDAEGLAQHVRFLEADFSMLPSRPSEAPLSVSRVSVVYSRFTLHAIDAAAQSRALRWAYGALEDGGLLAIEARSVLGSLYGKGTPVQGERDAFVHGHYRRFLRREDLVEELRVIGFSIAQEDERSGVAVFGDDDPVVIRVFARKS